MINTGPGFLADIRCGSSLSHSSPPPPPVCSLQLVSLSQSSCVNLLVELPDGRGWGLGGGGERGAKSYDGEKA
jgi:hypothetical protein